MKLILYKFLLLGILIPTLSFGNTNLNNRHTREKKITKEFNVDNFGYLDIDNSYGNVDISTWDENRIVIQVLIKVSGNNLDNVLDKLDNIEINFNQDGNRVTAHTNFEKQNKGWWNSLFSSSSNANREVNYIIKMPVKHNLVIDNDYGAIYIDRIEGSTDISCDYGKIDIGELRGKKNILNFDYTRNSHFGYIENAEIDADYSEFSIEEAKTLSIKADYSNSEVLKVVNLNFSCDYGSFYVEKVKNLEANGDYLTTKIGRVFTTLNLSQDYGSIRIDKLIKGTTRVKIDSDYAGIRLGYDSEMDFKFNIKTSYGNISGTEDLTSLKNHQENTSKEISGYYGKKESSNLINISTSYGNVSFRKTP
ncbi:hypothetical protein [Zunongwangia sp.]|uniref:hypothetical protein n=1 Tax=Zunongwangia sp. TaxID=1965325 RepID=UPI003AA99BDD